MTCVLCNDDYGMVFCKCEYSVCEICASIKRKCPYCKSDLSIKMFFGGKITHPCVEYANKPCIKTRLIVLSDEQDGSDIIDPECGALPIKEEDIINLEDFKNLGEYLMPILKVCLTTSLTGPCVIIKIQFCFYEKTLFEL